MVLCSFYEGLYKYFKVSRMNKVWTITFKVCALSIALILTGCFKHTTYPKLDDSQPYLAVPPQQLIAGTSVEDRPIMYYVLGQGPEVVFILATIHGDEPAGALLVKQLADYLQQQQTLLKGHTVVLMPVANPDGLAKNSRNNANNVDLNRNFESANRINKEEFGLTALSEPEAHIINRFIKQYSPERIVSIHQVVDTGPEGLATMMPTGCLDYDGPGQMLANHMAKYCDLPVQKLGASPGSLGSYAGVTLGIPTITFEMQKNDSKLDSEILWQRYGKALLAAIVYPDPIQDKQQ